jgi:small ligand-binding sensory domain FIST
MPVTTSTLRLASGLSGHPEPDRAAAQACAQVAESLAPGGDGGVELALVFVSKHHIDHAHAIGAQVKKELRAECVIGVSGEAVIGGRQELERSPGVSILAARLPGVSLHTFTADKLSPFEDSPDGLARLGAAFGADTDLRATFLFADPFSVPVSGLLPAMCRARAGGETGAIIGGMASGGAQAGSNILLLDGAVFRSGLVGVSLRGPVRVDCAVSQGCRGFGPPMVVTKARKNVILKLGGRPALPVIREIVESLPPDDQQLLESRGPHIGIVINEYKERFGRDDFLIRNVVGVDEGSEAIAINAFIRVGQTVRFHLRDAKTADEDLALLLDAQQLRDPPLGAMLVTCATRGQRLFERPNHDAAAIVRAFGPAPSGEELARGGQAITASQPPLPLAGFFASGEIGPVGPESYLHGHAACLTLFRSPK